MKKKPHARRVTKASKAQMKDLAPRNAAGTKGGFSAVNQVVKSIGEGLTQMARKG